MNSRAPLLLALAGLLLPPPGTAQDAFKTPISAGYQPQDKDERGLWLEMNETERLLKTSAFVVRDPALNTYVHGVLCKVAGNAACAALRLYLVRTADFNASMAPTGMMIVNTGLLLRVRDEAQLAAILGHEFTHYTHRHSLQGFRDARRKTTLMSWLSMMPVGGYAAAAAISLAQLGMIGSYFTFTRGMESEADAGSIPLMAGAGYDPHEASRIWEQLRAEQDATAAARNKKSRKDEHGLFATHPPTAERLAALKALADKQAVAGTPGTLDKGERRYRDVLRAWWPQLVDDKIKLNDFGATDFLLTKLAEDGWTPDLLYARGELYRTRGLADDLTQAAGFYRQATAGPDAPAEAWRGLGLVELRQDNAAAGRAALQAYLARKPDAADKSMITMLMEGA